MSHEQYWSPIRSDLHTYAHTCTCYIINKFLYVYDSNRSLSQHSLKVTSLDSYVGTTIIAL